VVNLRRAIGRVLAEEAIKEGHHLYQKSLVLRASVLKREEDKDT
jgi:hypothetical protein